MMRVVVVATLFAFALPLYLVAIGQFWTAGKATSMLTPFLFLILVYPALRPSRYPITRMICWAYIISQLLFGISRSVVVARADDGSFFRSPYPTMAGPEKASFDWDIGNHFKQLQGCELVRLEIDDPFLERIAEDYLIEQHLRWFTTREQFLGYGGGRRLGVVQATSAAAPDCVMTNIGSHRTDASIVVWVRRNP